MANRSPSDRLQKLFHKHDGRDTRREELVSTPSLPSASPSSAGLQQHVRQTSSHRSPREVVQSTAGNRHSRNESGRVSANVEDLAPPTTQPAAQVAAAKAMYPDQDIRLPNVAHQSDLSTDLQHLTLSDAAGRKPHSEDVADRNLAKRKALRNGVPQIGAEPANDSLPPNVKPLGPQADRHSEDVANWNIVQNRRSLGGPSGDLPAPLQVKKRASIDSRNGSIGSPISPVTSHGSHGLSHKSNVTDLRRSSDVARSRSPNLAYREPKTTLDADHHRIKRSSLEKPLPPRPSDEFTADLQGDQILRRDVGTAVSSGHHPGHTDELLDKDVDLTGVIDLSKTEDATLHERWAPAVTHEKIIQNVHHIREERITREIHNHHVFHRVLPIVDIEVLPARHFMPIEGGYAEISEDEVPGRTGANAQWLIAEMVSKGLPRSKGPVVPERFTARKFEGKDGDYKEYMTPEGFKRTETTWVHPPTYYEPGAIESGQTYPLCIGSPDPTNDGLRARLPEGKVIGVSPLLATQRQEQAETLQIRKGKPEEKAPPVPPHRVFPADLVDAARAGPATARG